MTQPVAISVEHLVGRLLQAVSRSTADALERLGLTLPEGAGEGDEDQDFGQVQPQPWPGGSAESLAPLNAGPLSGTAQAIVPAAGLVGQGVGAWPQVDVPERTIAPITPILPVTQPIHPAIGLAAVGGSSSVSLGTGSTDHLAAKAALALTKPVSLAGMASRLSAGTIVAPEAKANHDGAAPTTISGNSAAAAPSPMTGMTAVAPVSQAMAETQAPAAQPQSAAAMPGAVGLTAAAAVPVVPDLNVISLAEPGIVPAPSTPFSPSVSELAPAAAPQSPSMMPASAGAVAVVAAHPALATADSPPSSIETAASPAPVVLPASGQASATASAASGTGLPAAAPALAELPSGLAANPGQPADESLPAMPSASLPTDALPKGLRVMARRIENVMQPMFDRAHGLSLAALAARDVGGAAETEASDQTPEADAAIPTSTRAAGTAGEGFDDGESDDLSAGAGRVNNTFNVQVSLGNQGGLDAQQVQDALADLLRAAARRSGLLP